MCMRVELIRPRSRRRPLPREWSSRGLALELGLKCLVRIATGGPKSDTGKHIKTLALRHSDATLALVRGRGRERRASTVNSHP